MKSSCLSSPKQSLLFMHQRILSIICFRFLRTKYTLAIRLRPRKLVHTFLRHEVAVKLSIVSFQSRADPCGCSDCTFTRLIVTRVWCPERNVLEMIYLSVAIFPQQRVGPDPHFPLPDKTPVLAAWNKSVVPKLPSLFQDQHLAPVGCLKVHFREDELILGTEKVSRLVVHSPCLFLDLQSFSPNFCVLTP